MKLSQHNVLVQEPHISSMAALALMNRKFSRSELERWFAFREQFLRKHEPLICQYCGRSGLIIDIDKCSKSLSELATVDHVMPISKGGIQYDETNCVVACYRCNQKKKDKVLNIDLFVL